MPDHLHLVVEVQSETTTLSDVMRDFKKFTSKKIVKIITEIAESRREWLLDHFEFAGKYNPKIQNASFGRTAYTP